MPKDKPTDREQLLRSPTFHSVVGQIYRKVRHARHGKDPEEMGGTSIDRPGGQKGFGGHFLDELRDQFRSATKDKK
ncbi:hypothetical protein MMC25_002247 [Agyrium rufum]|nr:hypothetical protein [Agyrium rufum]